MLCVSKKCNFSDCLNLVFLVAVEASEFFA